jgi:hypothetical protein
MNDRLCSGFSLVLLACLNLSCARKVEGLASATGKVTSQGQPAAGAVLTFHRQPGGSPPPASVAQISPSANTREDGSFTVESNPVGTGIAPGDYRITVEWPEDANTLEQGGNDMKSKSFSVKGKTIIVNRRGKYGNVLKDRLKGRLADSSKTPFKAEIKAGSNDLGTLEIKD